MLDLRNKKVDTNKANDGVRIHWEGEAYITVGQIKNKAWWKAFNDIVVERLKTVDHADITEDDWEMISLEALAKGSVYGWEGIGETNDEGKMVELPFTPEASFELMKAVPELAELVATNCADFNNFRLNNIVEITKKSGK